MSRTCKKCGTIDYDIWGTIGLIGFSLIVGTMGYVLASWGFYSSIVIMGMLFGLILMLPMYLIAFHEKRELEKNEQKKEKRKREL